MIERIKTAVQKEDRAVSPVIGVILMVAITVILAAVIGSFVLGLGQDLNNNGPSVSAAVQDATSSAQTGTEGETLFWIDHNGGETLSISNLKITIRDPDTNNLFAEFDGQGASPNTNTDDGSIAEGKLVGTINANTYGADDTFSSGDRLIISEDTDTEDSVHTAIGAGDTVVIRIVHIPSDTGILEQEVTLQ